MNLTRLERLKQFLPPLALHQFNLLLALWLGIALNFAFYKQIQMLTPYQGLKAYAFLSATVLVVVALYNVVLQLLQWTWNAKIFAWFLVFVGGLTAYFVNSLGVVISPGQVQNMMQTDTKEALDLFSMQFVVWSVFMVVIPMVVIALIRIEHRPISKQLLSKGLHIVSSFAVIGGLLFVFYVDFAAIFREHRDLKGMISPQNTIASTLSYYRKQKPKENLPLVTYGTDAHRVINTSATSMPKLMVLVVGETARAESFSLNGYTKNTNPELSKQNVINFSQVSSCGTATAVSVPCMFSGMPRKDYDEQLAGHREGLLDIAQRSGYKVTWIDNNSGCKGACDRVHKFEIPAALKQKWCDAEGECMDEVLVDSLKAYVASIPAQDKTPQLIVLHQMGSHGPAYYKRSTEKFQPFKPMCATNAIQGCSRDELLNSYDNSIVYTDHILNQVIQTIKAVPNYQTGFWYLSDHGESTGESGMYLHGAPYAIAPVQQTHVPMIMWFSPAWQQHNASQVNCLTQQKQAVRSQDNLFPTLLSMLEIKTQVIDDKNDMLKQCANNLTGKA